MNYADSARIRAVLQHCWFFYEENIEKANIVIFDTCSVRQKSEDKITWKLQEIRPDQKIWITWCMIQHNFRNRKINTNTAMNRLNEKWNFLGSLTTTKPEILGFTNEEIERRGILHVVNKTVFVNHAFNPMFHDFQKKSKNIELFWRIDDTGFLPLMLEKLWYEVSYEWEFINEYENIIPESTSMNPHTSTAYVPISTWCNQFCAYCIVPYARGLEKYSSVEQVVKEVQTHLDRGVQEIVLLGQIVNKHPHFVEIVQQILKLPGLKRLRYTSPYPTYYSPELLALHEQEDKLCPHIHMPLQSGSDAVLKRMFRGYTVAEARQFIDNIRALKRDISITTDFILWFPWETEEDFQGTLDLVEYGKFDMIYMGIYSPRPGTLGAKKYTDDVPREVKHSRWTRLNEVLKRISYENNQAEIGKIRTMLVNEIVDGILIGYADNAKHISVKNTWSQVKIWDFVKVKITKWEKFTLEGEIWK